MSLKVQTILTPAEVENLIAGRFITIRNAKQLRDTAAELHTDNERRFKESKDRLSRANSELAKAEKSLQDLLALK